MYDNSNVFAKILRKELPSTVVFEDEYVLSIRDINPMADVHVLVLTKGKYENFHDLVENASEQEVSGFFYGVEKTVETLGVKDCGYKLVTNTGRGGGQEVPHLHVHILSGQSLHPK